MKSDEMIGILTYHSAYNYGSVLQAYATQCVLEKYFDRVEIINYRMLEQRKFYDLYRRKYGIRTLVKDLMQLPIHKSRKIRCSKFENFFDRYMRLSTEVSKPEEVYKFWNQYAIIVSGSDQIWNKHSHELENNQWEYMHPYLLKDFPGKKISYASSIANTTDEDLKKILPMLRSFDAISMREKNSQEKLSKQLNHKIEHVLDPTFLLDQNDWIRRLGLEIRMEEKYVLYYSLNGIAPTRERLPIIREYAKERGCKVKVITPFVYVASVRDDIVEICADVGPVDFLNMIYNACFVITDSYHGTILSVNFGKEVYSLCVEGGSEFRKTDILGQLGMERQIINDIRKLSAVKDMVDYTEVHEKISTLKNRSLLYLERAFDI